MGIQSHEHILGNDNCLPTIGKLLRMVIYVKLLRRIYVLAKQLKVKLNNLYTLASVLTSIFNFPGPVNLSDIILSACDILFWSLQLNKSYAY